MSSIVKQGLKLAGLYVLVRVGWYVMQLIGVLLFYLWVTN